MPDGLRLWKNGARNALLDADNLFWAFIKKEDVDSAFIPGRVTALYERVKDKLSAEMNEFRFSEELTAIYIDPTDRCNANCPYCYIPRKLRQRGRSMTRDELDYILGKTARHFKGSKRKQVIIFHASEPLLVKDIIFEAVVKYGKVFKFGIQTNGILLEKGDVEFLKKNKIGVGISLDSSSPAVNNRLRPAAPGEGNFARAVRALEWFDGYKGLNVIATMTRLNVNGLPGLVRFLHSKKVPCVLLNPMRFTQKSALSLKPDEKVMAWYFLEAVDVAMKLSRDTDHQIIIGNFANTILAIIAPLARRLMCDISPCGGGRCFFTITASGEMIPCGEFIGIRGYSGGNIFTDTIPQAMRSEAFKKIRKRVAEKIGDCDICDFRNICGAPCPAELHTLGGMYQKSVFCNFYKEVIMHAFKLIAEDKVKYLLRNESSGHLEYEYNINAAGRA